ncbi:nitroreductase family protein [Desulfovibrio sp. JC010]|uniref:nitroreductase family protein n=1 Tax=Desulfovibrio sp. JC010 TaxID=2593641 RepID=UPI0013D7A6FB|nr:nitroreductase family protein [Desulfovibrio sp. JC010]NDV28594.1 nitroreductase [Desulfovibrio sp. JC010]
MKNFSVNEELCVLCGLCAQDCFFGLIKLDEYPKISDDDKCFECQHCLSICPTGAISILGKSAEDCTPLKGNMPGEDQVSALIKGRRSVRAYKPEPLEPERIQKLLDTAWHAPTGVNSRCVHITLMDDPDSVKKFSNEVYARLDEAIEKGVSEIPYVANLFKMISNNMKENGVDMLFRDAPHFIIVSAPETAPSRMADMSIFLSYFELMAQSMKIGTLWNGLLKRVIESILPDLKEKLGIPADHELGYAMLFGKPAVKYQRTVERGEARVRRVEWGD